MGFRAVFYGEWRGHHPITIECEPDTVGLVRHPGQPHRNRSWVTMLVGCSCGELFARTADCFPKLSDEHLREHLRASGEKEDEEP